MSVSANRTAVDVAPRTARRGLALLLALLAVPGSTWAWDLPLGGLWIGLPLAVAAIVLGRRARRAGPPRDGHGRDRHRRPLHRADGDLQRRRGGRLVASRCREA